MNDEMAPSRLKYMNSFYRILAETKNWLDEKNHLFLQINNQ